MNKAFKKLCRLAGECIVRYRLINEHDRILVGLSGGKDSLVMMHLLTYLQSVAPVDFTCIAATFDPGFEGFGLDVIKRYACEQKWEHHIVPMNVAEILKEKGFENSPCVLCSRLRRGKLYGLAKELKCNKLALGQHIDDIAASFLMSLCRGQGLTTMAPLVCSGNDEHPDVIRPMALVPEALIKECADELQLPQAGNCRYRALLESGDRVFFGNIISEIAEKIPDLRSNIARSLSHIEPEHLMLLPEDKHNG